MKSKNEMGLKICVMSVLVVLVIGTKPQAREWCFKRTKYYSRTIRVPERVCRYVPGVPFASVPGVQNEMSRPRVPNTKSLRDDKTIAKQLKKSFPGLFLNKTTADELNRKLKKEVILPGRPGLRPEKGIIPGIRPEEERPGKQPAGENDGDLHCPTFRELAQAPNTLANVNSEMRDIVHFDSEQVFQFVHKGTCGSSSTQSCNGGSCLQEQSIVYLMVWKDDPDWPTAFEPFEVDSYCSCKGILP